MSTATRTLRRDRAGLYGLTLVAAGLSLYLLAVPGTPPLWVLAAAAVLPAWAIVRVAGSHDRLALVGGRRDRRTSLDWAFIMPILALGVSVLQDFRLVDPWRLALYAAPMGLAALGLLAQMVASVRRPMMALGVGFLLCAYAYDLLAELNVRFDPSEPQVFRAKVLEKHFSTSYRGHSMSATLAPWGPFTQPTSTTLRLYAYRSLHVGDTACVELHQGLLRSAWYEIEPCG